MKVTIALSVILVSLVQVSHAGECCVGYYKTTLGYSSYQAAQWCENYCCGSSTSILGLYCCDSVLLEADDFDQNDFCGLWWGHHIYVPIISSIVFVALLVGCCVCCYKCCCARNRTTVIMQQPMGHPGMFTSVQSSSMQSSGGMQQSGNSGYGYDQPAQFGKY